MGDVQLKWVATRFMTLRMRFQILLHQSAMHLHSLSQIIVDVHDFILGWKIVYLSAQTFVFLSVCFIYRELMIAIGFLFPFASNFKLIDATLFILEVGFYINCFRLCQACVLCVLCFPSSRVHSHQFPALCP